MRKINNNYIKFDSSTKFNTNNQYFSTGLYNRPYLKMPGIEWVNDVKAGDISAFKKYLTIRRAYSYYDDLLLLPLLHEDVRVKLIHHILDEGELLDVINVLEVLTHNYNLDKFKDELKPKLFKRLADANHLPPSYDERKKDEQWNELVIRLFGNSSDELITSYDEWKQGVVAITDLYPKEDVLLSARSCLDKHIEDAYISFNTKVVSNKFIGAYEYDNTEVWMYECDLLESKDDTTTCCYVVLPEIPDFLLTLYTNLKKGEFDYKKIVIDSIKSSFTTLM